MSFTDPNMEYWDNKTKIYYAAHTYLIIVMNPDLFISQGSLGFPPEECLQTSPSGGAGGSFCTSS